ncbi:MAG TPA: hypothetical protein VNO79_01915 [Actinomycetota bacterium]|nr:hypothetical protein [Actinomycetota bacterium]
MAARTPEELEMLLEDAFVMRDTDALSRLFVEGAVFVQGDVSARGRHQVARLLASMWEAGPSHVAGEGRILQARDLALAVGKDGISVMRQEGDRRWRYAIVTKGGGSGPAPGAWRSEGTGEGG